MSSLPSPVSFLQLFAPEAVQPTYTQADGYEYRAPAALPSTSAVVIDAAAALRALLDEDPADNLPGVVDDDRAALDSLCARLWQRTVDEYAQCSYTELVVLCFDGTRQHPLREAVIATRERPAERLRDRVLAGTAGQRRLADAMRRYAAQRCNLRPGLTVVLHGAWAEPWCVWSEQQHDDAEPPRRHVGTVRADRPELLGERLGLPADWCRSGDRLVYWCRALLFGPSAGVENDNELHSVLVVTDDGYAQHALLLLVNWMVHREEQRRWRLTLRASFDAGVQTHTVAGQTQHRQVVLPVWIDMPLAVTTLSMALAARMHWLVDEDDSRSVLPLLLALLWPVGTNEFTLVLNTPVYRELGDTGLIFNALNMALRHRRLGAAPHRVLHVSDPCDAFSATAITIERDPMVAILTTLRASRAALPEPNNDAARKRREQALAELELVAARQTYWLALLYNASLPGSPVPDPTETDQHQVSLWGYTRRVGDPLLSAHTVVSSRSVYVVGGMAA